MNELTRAFHLEEYKQVKQEMVVQQGRIEILARRSLIVSAVVFAWVAVQGVGTTSGSAWCAKLPRELSTPVWFIPFAYCVASGLGAFAAYWRSSRLALYVSALESELAADGFGWESLLKRSKPIFGPILALLWLLLLVSTLLAGAWGHIIHGKDRTAVLALMLWAPTPSSSGHSKGPLRAPFGPPLRSNSHSSRGP